MKVLVTGAAGNIGRRQVQELLVRGHSLRTLDRKSPEAPVDWEHLDGDLRDSELVDRAVKGMDAVAHLGAIPGDRNGHEHEVMEVNVMGTWNVLNACVAHGVSRAVCFSSVQALGNVCGFRETTHLPVDDTYPRHPMSPYQLSKHLNEETCRSFSNRYGMITICLRPTYVTSEDSYARWSVNARDDSSVGAVSNFWAYVDVRDVARATAAALVAEGIQHDAFLLAADDTTSLKPTSELIDRFYPNVPWVLDRDEYLAGDPYRGLLDCSAARSRLGWRPQHSWRREVESPSAA